ncbi:MAG: hypothetical protein Q8O08_16540, partial [Methyloversatilis sp.]|nr:hypothetical protein [Methyloversatilis sp.]
AFGLVMDVHQSALLGQHALSYATLSFFAVTIHRRLLWYPVVSQALQAYALMTTSADTGAVRDLTQLRRP